MNNWKDNICIKRDIEKEGRVFNQFITDKPIGITLELWETSSESKKQIRRTAVCVSIEHAKKLSDEWLEELDPYIEVKTN